MRTRTMFWCVLAIVAATVSTAAAQQPIRWESDLQMARQFAAQSNRLLLVHFWAPGCGPCVAMEQNVLNEPGVLAVISAAYVPVKLNIEQNRPLAQQWNINGVPTDVILTSQGQVVSVLQGYRPPQQYAAALQQAVAKVQSPPTSQFAAQPPAPNQFAAQPPAQPYPSQPYAPQQPPFAPGIQQPGPPSPGPNAFAAAPPVQPNFNQPNFNQPNFNQPTSPPAMAGAGGPPTAAPQQPQQQIQPSGPAPLALDGCCPVTLVEKGEWKLGDRRWGAVHDGRTYLFVGPEQQQRFLANNNFDRYSPVHAGQDIVVQLDEGRSIDGRRQHGVFFNQHIYLFADERSLAKFRQNPRQYVETFDRAVQAARSGSSYR